MSAVLFGLALALLPVAPENLLVIDTSKGRVLVEMRPDIAPLHVERVRLLARKGFYDDNVFYRVVPGYMAQTGEKHVGGNPISGEGTLTSEFRFDLPQDAGRFYGSVPVARGSDGKGYVKFCPGVAAIARYDDPDSGDSQIFIMTGASPPLERQFTAWGRVVSGLDVVKALAPGEPPSEPDRMLRARVASDLPPAERPRVSVGAPPMAADDNPCAVAVTARVE